MKKETQETIGNETEYAGMDAKKAASLKTADQLLAAIDELLEQMETEMPLEQRFELYRKGLELVRECEEKLGRMEQEMKILSSDDEIYGQ